ncbi:hypothetical protein [Pseudomonas aeruginosa]|uniref:hypothetical protein n=1 Tax=Pseudomonas aeruginosa TaxID=287 RepID=UPI0021F0CA6E|nr:hypothetical protein [Pseudomonas aeruginosa]MCV4111721.1 hypothetical protein [Pseudomonas aeruginosa]MCV4244649.1 hypothetical protein [Pseudomonas aeruginosa]MCV4250834.1 hypothetical protein [Pseudomonas aeruginosa]HCL3477226.1 hypothetical protein [Pseudomonas aeruginosa]
MHLADFLTGGEHLRSLHAIFQSPEYGYTLTDQTNRQTDVDLCSLSGTLARALEQLSESDLDEALLRCVLAWGGN